MNLVDLAVIVFVGSLGILIGALGIFLIIMKMKVDNKLLYVGPMKVKNYIAIIGLKKNRGTEIIYKDPSVAAVELGTGSFKDFLRDRKDHR